MISMSKASYRDWFGLTKPDWQMVVNRLRVDLEQHLKCTFEIENKASDGSMQIWTPSS